MSSNPHRAVVGQKKEVGEEGGKGNWTSISMNQKKRRGMSGGGRPAKGRGRLAGGQVALDKKDELRRDLDPQNHQQDGSEKNDHIPRKGNSLRPRSARTEKGGVKATQDATGLV